MKTDYLERRMKLNKNTSVIIKSQKMKDADFYKNTVSLIHHTSSEKPMKMFTRSEIESYLADIDLSDDQTELLFGIDPDNKTETE